MGHGDPHGIIAVRDGFSGKSVPLRSQDHRQLLLRFQSGIVYADRVITKSHRRCTKSQFPKKLHTALRPESPAVETCPGNLKNRPHTDSRRSAVQRIAASGSEQDGVHIQGGRRPEDRAHIHRIHHILKYSDPAGVPADLLNRRQFSAAHGAEHSSGKSISLKLKQCFPVRHIYRRFPAALKNAFGFFILLPFLDEKRHRFISGVHGPPDHLRAFRDKDSRFRLIISQ